MNIQLMFYMLGRSVLALTAALILPIGVSMYYALPEGTIFALSFALGGFMSFFLLEKGYHHRRELSLYAAVAYLISLWGVLSLVGMLPFFLGGVLSPVDAFFEAVSAVTTVGISLLPAGTSFPFLLWRAELAFLGALFFLISVVTVLPLVGGSFGISVAFRENISFSPIRGQMDNMTRQVAAVYISVTVFSFILYVLAGLDPIAALVTAFLTMSTAGGDTGKTISSAGTVDAGNFLAFDGNPWPEIAVTVTMLIASSNLLLYWYTLKHRQYRDIYQYAGWRVFLLIILVMGLAFGALLWKNDLYSPSYCLLLGFFHVLSFLSTSGYAIDEIGTWPDLTKFFLCLLPVVGGCIGSATGGLKVLRVMILFKMAAAEIRRLLHPHMLLSVRIGSLPAPNKVVGSILIYFFAYITFFFLLMLLLSLSGENLSAAFGMALATFTTLGSGVGLYEKDAFLVLAAPLKITAAFFMITARAEIFVFLIMLQSIVEREKKKW